MTASPQCCQNCFRDRYLKEAIKSSGSLGSCGFCGSDDVRCIEPTHLNTTLDGLIDVVYERSRIEKTENLLHNRLQNDWVLFSEGLTKRDELLELILQESLQEAYYEPVPLFEVGQAQIDQIWNSFCSEIKNSNRFFPETDIDPGKLEDYLRSSVIQIESGQMLFRARNTATNSQVLGEAEMGKPPPYLASSGRANPQGVAYLYVATTEDTAIAEVRPSCKEFLTVGTFQVLEHLRIVDLRGEISSPFHSIVGEDPDVMDLIKGAAYREKLSEGLSRIVHHGDKELNYLPTQYFCEFIKKCKWDGVMYKSSLGTGDNLAIFSDYKLRCTSTELKEIRSIDYSC